MKIVRSWQLRALEVYVHGSEGRLLQAARGDRVDGLEAASVLKKAKKENRLQDWEEKALHGQYLRQTKEVRSEQSWAWLQNGDLKRETESLLVVAQNQSIRSNLVKAKIDKSQKGTLCRVCKKADESIDHVVNDCSKLAQKKYKSMIRHDNLGKIVHWNLARKCNFEAGDKWYEHEPESVSASEDYKILWDFRIQIDHVIKSSDLAVVDKNKRTCKIIDFAVPGDSRIEEKEKEKTEKYQDLRRELQKIWNVRVKIIPLVVGPLGAIPKQFGSKLKETGVTAEIGQVQKIVQ